MGVQSEQEVKQGFIIKDSGQRQSFDSGMVRDVTDGKLDVELIFNGPMVDRWTEHLTKGAKKYPDTRPGVPNWMLASGEAELIRFRKSAARHFRQWLRGDEDEDHAAAVFFNVNGYEYVKALMEEEIKIENQECDGGPMYRELVRELARSNFEVEGPIVFEKGEVSPVLRVPDHELPQTTEPVLVGRHPVMLLTPEQALRKIKQMDREEEC